MKPYPALLRGVFLPIASAVKGMMVVPCLEELERTEWYSREKIMRLQAKKLRALLDHANRNVPHYRRAFIKSGIEPSDIRNPSDLAKLPVLEKDDVRNSLGDLVARNRPFGKLHLMSTSGSTGQPLRFYQDNRAQSYMYAANIRNNRRVGLEYGEKYVRFTGLPLGSGVRGPVYDIVHNLVTRRVGSFPSYGINEHALLQYVRRIRKSKPKCIIGYASALNLMAAFMQERGISDLTVDAIISTSEQLWRRETIEEAFHSRVFDDYSSREFSIAAECEMRRGYHISSEIVLLEVVRDNEHVSDGELGEILVTDLTNWGMPFIRYRIGDLGRPSDDLCPCGRGLPLLEGIEGRSMDYITSSDGRILSGGNLTMLFKDLPVRQFRVHQVDYAKVSVQLVTATGYTTEHTRQIVSGMKRIMGSDTSVEILFRNKLDASSVSGKHRFIVSDVSTALFGGKRITRDSSS